MFRKFCVVMMAVVGLVFCSQVFGQMVNPPEVEWEKTLILSNYNSPESVLQTNDGGYIIAGSAGESVFTTKTFLIKTDAIGNKVWGKSYKGDSGKDVLQTVEGNYMVCGAYKSIFIPPFGIDFDMYILKADVFGNKIWDNTFGIPMTSAEGGKSLVQTKDGEFVIAGSTGPVDGGSEWDIYLVKIDAQGNKIWSKDYYKWSVQRANCIQTTKDGRYVIVGESDSAATRLDIYILKVDRSGNKEWESIIVSNEDEHGDYFQITDNGGFIIVGRSWALWPSNIKKMLLVKTDSNGNQEWTKRFEENTWGWGNCIKSTRDGGYIVSGTRVMKLNSNGDVEWEKALSGIRYAQQTADGGYILVATNSTCTNTNCTILLTKLKADKFIIDCNKNGIDDAQDIAGGTSKDCNANKIPDECDIVQATSQDKNNNGIPDECEIPNQPPQITHTPITSAIQNQNIKVEFEAKDLDGILSSVEVFYRVTGAVDYQSVGMSPAPSQTQFTLEIPANAVTLAGVDYYIEAKDTEGATKTTPVYHVNVIDKWPVIIIPGIMGSELKDVEDDSVLWPKIGVLSFNDPWLLKLQLQNDGKTPDSRNRCSYDLTQICNSWIECSLLDECLLPGHPCCIEGGKDIKLGNLLKIPVLYQAYDDLIYFLLDGYSDKVFTFPYDWRLDLRTSSAKLKEKIDEVCLSTGLSKVNIIAHSMGGLVARTYTQQHINDHRIDTMIFLGTPQRGSPISYATLEGYKSLIGLLREIWPLDQNWWLELDTQTFVCQNFPTAYQTLPRYGYVMKGNEFEEYSISNEALRNNNGQLLDKAIEFFKLIEKPYPQDIKYYSILGTALPTLNGFEFQGGRCKGVSIDFWADGKVPNISSTWFGLDKKFFVKVKHASLPGDIAVEKKVLKLLIGDPNTPVTGIYDTPQKYEDEQGILKKIKKITGCSPVSLKISDTEDKIVGVDNDGTIKEQIPNSEYFKFEENEAGYFPDGEYVIEIKGKGSGEFTIILETMEDNDLVTEVVEYKNIPVVEMSKGIILITEQDPSPKLYYDVDGDNTDDFILNPGEEPPEDLKSMFAQKGDINHDNSVDISDGINILKYLFLGEKANCPEAGEVNSDNTMDVSDAIYLLSYLFLGTQKKPEGLVLCR